MDHAGDAGSSNWAINGLGYVLVFGQIMDPRHAISTAVLCRSGMHGRLMRTLHTAGAQNSSGYATGGTGFVLMSNFTTDAISVASAATLGYTGAPGYPVVEATISSIHQVSHPTALAADRCISWVP